MRAAHARLTALYGDSGAYAGEFYPGPHRFDRQMQDSAFGWLDRRLS
jgi:hypothetical protein